MCGILLILNVLQNSVFAKAGHQLSTRHSICASSSQNDPSHVVCIFFISSPSFNFNDTPFSLWDATRKNERRKLCYSLTRLQYWPGHHTGPFYTIPLSWPPSVLRINSQASVLIICMSLMISLGLISIHNLPLEKIFIETSRWSSSFRSWKARGSFGEAVGVLSSGRAHFVIWGNFMNEFCDTIWNSFYMLIFCNND